MRAFAVVAKSIDQEALEVAARAAGWVPLADVLDALRDHKGFERWAHATGHPSCYLDEVWPNSDEIADYLTARFAPTPPEGADERNGHG
jgi:hypothetical protein